MLADQSQSYIRSSIFNLIFLKFNLKTEIETNGSPNKLVTCDTKAFAKGKLLRFLNAKSSLMSTQNLTINQKQEII